MDSLAAPVRAALSLPGLACQAAFNTVLWSLGLAESVALTLIGGAMGGVQVGMPWPTPRLGCLQRRPSQRQAP